MLASVIERARRTFPAVVVTGPRQSGKTTLLKSMYSGSHSFVSLEDPDVRLRANEDPLLFLDSWKPPVILDEIQYAPELLPYIKSRIDLNRKPGQWLLTGSQSFVLMQGITESLAGRAAILSLLPFSLSERLGKGGESEKVYKWLNRLWPVPIQDRKKIALSEVVLRGNYPEIATKRRIDRQLWCNSYIATYLERDVRNLSQIGDLTQFQIFLRICATRTGQILDLSGMAREIGVSIPTAKRWLSILETGHQVFLLYPYYRNIGKRLIKRPKLYFNDTALATYLLGIQDRQTLLHSPHWGSLFETFVVTDVLKRFLHSGQMPSMYYFRTQDGLEVDLVVEHKEKLYLFEVKSAMTILPKHATSLIRLRRELGSLVELSIIISQSPSNFFLQEGVACCNWNDLLAV